MHGRLLSAWLLLCSSAASAAQPVGWLNCSSAALTQAISPWRWVSGAVHVVMVQHLQLVLPSSREKPTGLSCCCRSLNAVCGSFAISFLATLPPCHHPCPSIAPVRRCPFTNRSGSLDLLQSCNGAALGRARQVRWRHSRVMRSDAHCLPALALHPAPPRAPCASALGCALSRRRCLS